MKTLSFIILISSSSFAFAVNQCPLNNDAKSIILEGVIRNRLEAAWIVTQSGQGTFPSRGFSRNLIGSSSAHTGVFTLIEQCTGPRTFEPFCEPCIEDNCPTKKRCSQLACIKANVDTVALWWQPAPFKYTTDQPSLPDYKVTYATIPKTQIRFDGTDPGLLKITWKANDMARAMRDSQNPLNVSSSLIANAQRTEDGPQFANVHIQYPYISLSQELTKIDFNINEHGVLSGLVKVGKRTVGTIVEAPGEEVARIDWRGNCAD